MFQIAYMVSHPKQTAAFTLIELSIVLVVIGLLVGGVLVGQDLIQGAKDRAAMSELEKYGVAYNTFRLKYNCIAGDCKNASMFGLGDDGNGDKVLNFTQQGSCPGGSSTLFTEANVPLNGCGGPSLFAHYELQRFWAHLSAAELINEDISVYNLSNGSGTAFPPSQYFPKFKNGSSDSHYLVAFSWGGKTLISTGLYTVASNRSLRFRHASLKGSSVRNITSKLGYEYVEHTNCTNDYTNCSYPDALAQGQRVIASVAGSHSGVDGLAYRRPNSSAGGGATNCATTTAYNEDGDCHLIWQID